MGEGGKVVPAEGEVMIIKQDSCGVSHNLLPSMYSGWCQKLQISFAHNVWARCKKEIKCSTAAKEVAAGPKAAEEAVMT